MSTTARQSTRQHIGPVVQCLHSLEDAASRLFTDIALAAKYLRYRDDGDPKIVCDVFQPCGQSSLPSSAYSSRVAVPVRTGPVLRPTAQRRVRRSELSSTG